MSVDSPDRHSQNGTTDTWDEFKATNNIHARNRLIEEYLPIVRYQAERLHSTMPEAVELDDLQSAGVFGLMDAIEAFSLERGVKFETYCVRRIHGAMIDELRRMDHAPRLVRARNKQVQITRLSLTQALQRNPTDEETADALRSDGKKPVIMQDGSSVKGMTSLQRTVFETDSQKEVTPTHAIPDERVADPSGGEERRDFYHEMYKGLNQAERLLLILYYREKLTMKEIGHRHLGLSESRVSQMHSQIIAYIRDRYAKNEACERRMDIDPNVDQREAAYWDAMFAKLTDAIMDTAGPTPSSQQSDPAHPDMDAVHLAQ